MKHFKINKRITSLVLAIVTALAAPSGVMAKSLGGLSILNGADFSSYYKPVIQGAGYANLFISGSGAREHASVLALEARLEGHSALFADIAITDVDAYVNIRKEPSPEAEIVGKIYGKSAAHIDDTVTNETGKWYKIHSGSCRGYISAQYFVTGAEAEGMAKEVGQMYVTVKAETLRLREKPDINSETLALLSSDDRFNVVGEEGEWVKIKVDDDLVGYAMSDYVEFGVKYKEAISIEEELEEIARQKRLAEQRAKAEKKANTPTSTKSSSTTSSTKSTSSTTSKVTGDPGTSAGSVSERRWALVEYACSFVGSLKYVSGGNSLETGTDCSGFVQQVFKKFGISLPRVSDDQGYCGESVSAEKMRPGDIVYYEGHVAIYIGDGQVVHCSSPDSDPNTKISSWNYRTPKRIANVWGD